MNNVIYLENDPRFAENKSRHIEHNGDIVDMVVFFLEIKRENQRKKLLKKLKDSLSKTEE